MEKLAQMKERRATLIESNKALVDKLMDEDRMWTDEEREEYDGNMEIIESLKGDIERLEKHAAIADQRDSTPIKPTTYKVGKDRREDEQYTNIGEQLVDVWRACAPGGEVSPRLRSCGVYDEREDRATGFTGSIPSDGGFLLQDTFISDLLTKTYPATVVASACSKVQYGSNSTTIKVPAIDESSRADGSRFGGIRGYWVGEGKQITSSQGTVAQVELSAHKIGVLVYATEEMMVDTTLLSSVINLCVPQELAFKLDNAIVAGDGAGKPMGIINAPATIAVAKEGSQPADTVVYENVEKMWSRGWGASRPKMVWYISQNIEPQLHQMVLAGTSSDVPVYMPAGGISASPYDKLFNRPVYPIEHCSTLGDLGDIILADMSQYLLAEKEGIKSASSVHIRFDYDEVAFKFTYRVDGQPWWNSALTPYNGGDTLSPFVTLAERA